jgi:transposase
LWYPSGMAPQRKQLPIDWREGRRQRAWELHEQGWKQKDIAAAVGVTQGAVSQWIKRGRDGGLYALRRRPAPGATPRLTAEQRAQLVDALAQGAPAFGFVGEVWTTKRIVAIIRELFGVSYHPAHVSRLVRALGQRVQLPVTQATQRDDAAIAAWQDERWPALKKRLPQKDEPLYG